MKEFLASNKSIMIIGIMAFSINYSINTGQLDYFWYVLTCVFFNKFYSDYKSVKL